MCKVCKAFEGLFRPCGDICILGPFEFRAVSVGCRYCTPHVGLCAAVWTLLVRL